MAGPAGKKILPARGLQLLPHTLDSGIKST